MHHNKLGRGGGGRLCFQYSIRFFVWKEFRRKSVTATGVAGDIRLPKVSPYPNQRFKLVDIQFRMIHLTTNPNFELLGCAKKKKASRFIERYCTDIHLRRLAKITKTASKVATLQYLWVFDCVFSYSSAMSYPFLI